MKKVHSTTLISLALSALFLTGCGELATKDELNNVQSELMKADLAQLEKTKAELQEVQSKLTKAELRIKDLEKSPSADNKKKAYSALTYVFDHWNAAEGIKNEVDSRRAFWKKLSGHKAKWETRYIVNLLPRKPSDDESKITLELKPRAGIAPDVGDVEKDINEIMKSIKGKIAAVRKSKVAPVVVEQRTTTFTSTSGALQATPTCKLTLVYNPDVRSHIESARVYWHDGIAAGVQTISVPVDGTLDVKNGVCTPSNPTPKPVYIMVVTLDEKTEEPLAAHYRILHTVGMNVKDELVSAPLTEKVPGCPPRQWSNVIGGDRVVKYFEEDVLRGNCTDEEV